MSAALTAGALHLGSHHLLRPVGDIQHAGLDLAHEGQLVAVLLDQLGQIVGGDTTLPDIHAHLHHEGDEVLAVAVVVVHDQYAVFLVETVDLLISGQNELLKHSGGEEGVLRCAPVIVVQHGLDVALLDHHLGKVQLALGEEVDEVMHLLGLFIEVGQCILHAHQGVETLENTLRLHGADILIVAVGLSGDAVEHTPVTGILGDEGLVEDFTPLGDVLQHAMLVIVEGECTHLTIGQRPSHAELIHSIGRAGEHRIVAHVVGVGHQQVQELILLHKAVGLAALGHYLAQIFLNS